MVEGEGGRRSGCSRLRGDDGGSARAKLLRPLCRLLELAELPLANGAPPLGLELPRALDLGSLALHTGGGARPEVDVGREVRLAEDAVVVASSLEGRTLEAAAEDWTGTASGVGSTRARSEACDVERPVVEAESLMGEAVRCSSSSSTMRSGASALPRVKPRWAWLASEAVRGRRSRAPE